MIHFFLAPAVVFGASLNSLAPIPTHVIYGHYAPVPGCHQHMHQNGIIFYRPWQFRSFLQAVDVMTVVGKGRKRENSQSQQFHPASTLWTWGSRRTPSTSENHAGRQCLEPTPLKTDLKSRLPLRNGSQPASCSIPLSSSRTAQKQLVKERTPTPQKNDQKRGQVVEGANLSPQLAAVLIKRIILIDNKKKRDKYFSMFKAWMKKLGENTTKEVLRDAYGCKEEDPCTNLHKCFLHASCSSSWPESPLYTTPHPSNSRAGRSRRTLSRRASAISVTRWGRSKHVISYIHRQGKQILQDGK